MKQTFLKAYESPKAEVIEIESQGVLCVSEYAGITGQGGRQFGTSEGSWG